MATTCLDCGYTFTAHTAIGTATTPAPGAVSVCIECAGVAFFTDTGLRRPDDVEAAQLLADPDVRRLRAAVSLAQGDLR